MSRAEILRPLFDIKGKGLEIGPSFNPLVPKAEGFNVEIVDHLSAEGLREKYKDANVDLSKIENVDYISDGGSISELIGKSEFYDFCVALHVIEHTVDLIGFLLDCDKLLNDNGILVLAVPDKRFSFDVLRPICSTGDVIQAHLEGRKSHSLGKVFDEFSYNALCDGLPAWEPSRAGNLTLCRSVQSARELFEHMRNNNQFIDIHAWQFTPSSFRLILHDLYFFNFTRLKEASFLNVGAGEFYMTLSRSGAGFNGERIDLARSAIKEQSHIKV